MPEHTFISLLILLGVSDVNQLAGRCKAKEPAGKRALEKSSKESHELRSPQRRCLIIINPKIKNFHF